MNDFITSLIRTNVPIIVGAFIAWLVSLGVEVPEGAETPLIVGLTAVIIALYYSLVRWAESKWPAFGYLLGTKREPVYSGDEPDGPKPQRSPYWDPV